MNNVEFFYGFKTLEKNDSSFVNNSQLTELGEMACKISNTNASNDISKVNLTSPSMTQLGPKFSERPNFTHRKVIP